MRRWMKVCAFVLVVCILWSFLHRMRAYRLQAVETGTENGIQGEAQSLFSEFAYRWG